MTRERKAHLTPSLAAWLQHAPSVLQHTPSIPVDQQRAVVQVCNDLLQACAVTTRPPFPMHDMQEVRGQNVAKRVLEVAAAGGHHLLLVGPRGVGKTLLARTFPSLLPESPTPMPWRAPDASSAAHAFLGSAEPVLPGEMTLAHEGVLCLEHLSAFPRAHLVALRQATEAQQITLTHGEKVIQFPARFLLVATLEPCPCGYADDPVRACLCSPRTLTRYRQRLQAVVESCFALMVRVQPAADRDLLSRHPEEDSASIRRRVTSARAVQHRRFAGTPWRVNADLPSLNELERVATLDRPAQMLLQTAQQQLHLSAQSLFRVQQVARTIADLAGASSLAPQHLAEAIQYRVSLGR